MIRLNAKSKYGSRQVTVDGRRFDSQGEALRFQELRYMALAGEIADLECQVPYELHAGGTGSEQVIGKYVADFRYFVQKTGQVVTEDFKGFDTPLSRWKRKHVSKEYGITVVVTRQGRRSRKPRAKRKG